MQKSLPLVLTALALALMGGAGVETQSGPQPANPPQAWAWHQASLYAGAPTWFSVAFVIGNTAYVGTGYDSTNAFWRYDSATDTWDRSADFPGPARGAAFAFSVSNKGYIGTGFQAGARFADLWEYDPALDAWREKTPVPGGPRDHAAAFVVDGRAFIAGGMTCKGNDCWELREVWEYEPRFDRWTRKGDLPEPSSAAACFVLNGKAYLTGGRVAAAFSRSVLEYEPRNDRWTRKAVFPGAERSRAVAFAIKGRGYVTTGMQSISPGSAAAVLRDIWEYDPGHDAWTRMEDLPGPARGAAVAFVAGSRVFIGTGVDSRRTLLNDFWWSDARVGLPQPSTGIRALTPAAAAAIDDLVKAQMANCRFLNLAVVINGRTVLTKAYGAGQLGGEYEYGSVSKPVTSTILMQLRGEGRIRSLDDNVWTYVPELRHAMPAAYKDSPLTLKHLLTHRSGIPHNDQPPLVDGRFNLKFQPGTDMLYSTPGYGLLGQVIEAVTGLSYSEAVRRYIGNPVGARSFRAYPAFIAPGAYVSSTIDDMARWAIGVMGHRYMPADVLYREVLRPENGSYGYGWTVKNVGSDDVNASHGGSNGLPRAHVLLEPRRQAAVVILAQMRVMAPLDLDALARSVLAAADRTGATRR